MEKIIGVEYIKTLSQSTEGISSEIQDVAIRDYAENNNITIVKKYVDDVKTYTNEVGDAFKQLVDEADFKVFQVVLIYNMSKLTRDGKNFYFYLNKLKEKGIKVIFVKEQFQDNPLGELAMSMQIAMNDYWNKHPEDNEEIEQI